MLGMLSAEGAILAALQTVGLVFLVLDRVVVPLLAFFASECDLNSCVCSHSFGTSYFIYPREKAGIASLYIGRKKAVCAEKSAQKETSRPTGKLKYSTAPRRGQHFFEGFFMNFQGFLPLRAPFSASCCVRRFSTQNMCAILLKT
jgi:hypothetical protein